MEERIQLYLYHPYHVSASIYKLLSTPVQTHIPYHVHTYELHTASNAQHEHHTQSSSLPPATQAAEQFKYDVSSQQDCYSSSSAASASASSSKATKKRSLPPNSAVSFFSGEVSLSFRLPCGVSICICIH